jgi:hypothetical protein
VWKRLTFPSIFLGNEGKKRLDSKWELDMDSLVLSSEIQGRVESKGVP